MLLAVETATLESTTRYRAFKPEVFTEYKTRVLVSAGLAYVKSTRGFDSVGGYRYFKDYVKNRILKLLKNPELAKHYSIRTPEGTLLYGLLGTGKT